MGNIEKEPMLELFMEESIQLITELNSIVDENREQNRYEYESIKEIFRIFHTLKADATMMLFENIAEPARKFERILYYYRDKEKEVKDALVFNELLDEIVGFVQGELDKIEMSGQSDGDCGPLVEKIEDFYNGLGASVAIPEEKKEKQVYYIAGVAGKASDTKNRVETGNMVGGYVIEKNPVADTKDDRKEKENQDVVPLKARQETKYNRKKHTLITEEDITALKNICNEMEEVLNGYGKRFKTVSIIALEEDNLDELRAYSRRIRRWIREVQATDFKGIALKMKNVVKEMEETLSKPVELTITGEDTVIEKTYLEKISSAMIHLLRNSVDHGIESAEERKKAGKDEVGHVYIDITEENHKIKIVVSDDGAGLDKKQILERAGEKGLLTKPEEEYTEQEIYNLLLLHGFTTSKQVTNYSGLGVGLDVVNQNVKDMGGEIFIDSQPSKGTRFTILL